MEHTLGTIHEFDVQSHTFSCSPIHFLLYTVHFAHLKTMRLWIGGTLFHTTLNGNYNVWHKNPFGHNSVAHGLWNPHLGTSGEIGLHDCRMSGVICHSGMYSLLFW